jgi:hypothetical protein
MRTHSSAGQKISHLRRSASPPVSVLEIEVCRNNFGRVLTNLVQVLSGSFVLRIMSFSKHDLLAPDLLADLEAKAPAFFKWANAVVEDKHLTCVWNEQAAVRGTKIRLAELAEGKKNM